MIKYRDEYVSLLCTEKHSLTHTGVHTHSHTFTHTMRDTHYVEVFVSNISYTQEKLLNSLWWLGTSHSGQSSPCHLQVLIPNNLTSITTAQP